MNKYIQPLDPFAGVGWPSTGTAPATVPIPTGKRIYDLGYAIDVKSATGQKASIYDAVDLQNFRIGGELKRSCTAYEMDRIMTAYDARCSIRSFNITAGKGLYDTIATGDSVRFLVKFFFAEPYRENWAARAEKALFTEWDDGLKYKSMSLELMQRSAVVNATDTIDRTVAPVIKGYYQFSNEIGRAKLPGTGVREGLIERWVRTQKEYTGTGEFPISNLDMVDSISEVALFSPVGSADYITSLSVDYNDGQLIDSQPVERLVQALVDYGWNESELRSYPGVVRFSPDRMDFATDLLPLFNASKFKLRPVLGTAAATNKMLTIIAKYVSAPF